MLNKIFWSGMLVAGLGFAYWHTPTAPPTSPTVFVRVPADHASETTQSTRFSAATLVRPMEKSREALSPEEVTAARWRQLVRVDAAAAARSAESLASDAGRDVALRTVAQAWADQDATGALAWAAQLPDPNEKQAAQANIVFQVAQADPTKAIAVAQQLNLEGGYDLLPTLAVQWASRDWSAAQTWAQSLPTGDQRDQIMARMAFMESQTAPVAAGNRVLTEIPPGAVQDEAVMTVLHQWSLIDMPGAQAWVRAFPESPIKDRALSELVVVYRQ